MDLHILDKETEELLKEILENDKNFPAILRDKLQELDWEESVKLRAKIKLLIEEGYISKLTWGDNLPLVGRIEQKGRAYFELKEKALSPTMIKNNGKVFISHSSKDIFFVNKLVQLLILLGINRTNIFCSSIEAQGVSHGKKIEEAVRNQIIEDEILVYIISYNFLSSNYCLNELGAGWILSDQRTQGKELFLIKLPDINFDDIKGFISGTNKFTEINKDSISTFIEEVEGVLKLPTKKLTEYNNIIDTFLSDAQQIINSGVQETKAEQEKLEKLKKVLLDTNTAERKIISEIFNSSDATAQLEATNAMVNMLEKKKIIITFESYVDLFDPICSYTLQPWVYKILKEDNQVCSEIIGR